jgi:hypothetical protein
LITYNDSSIETYIGWFKTLKKSRVSYRALRVNLEAKRFTGPGSTELAPTNPLYNAPGTLNALPFTTSSKPTRATSSDVHHKNSGNCV